MSKFKVGDPVICVEKKCKSYIKPGFKYTITDIDIDNDLIKIDDTVYWYDSSYFKLIKNKFKTGDEVKVSNDKKHWQEAVYIGYNNAFFNHHVVRVIPNIHVDEFKYCRHQRKEYTLKECADALGVHVDEFRIKDE